MKRILLFLTVNLLIVASVFLLSHLLGLKNQVQPFLIFCFFWGLIFSLVSLIFSKKWTKWMMGVQLITLHGPHKNLVENIHRLSRRAGLTQMPEVGIYQDQTRNAFAVGPSRNDSLLAISSGLLSSLNQDEVEGVLAHEVAHIANGDMVTMELLMGVNNAFVMVTSLAISGLFKKETIFNVILRVCFTIIFTSLATPLVTWFSRDREFRADQEGADLAGKEKMISALTALRLSHSQMTSPSNDTIAHLKSMQISSRDSFFRVFSSHPLLSKRIDLIEHH